MRFYGRDCCSGKWHRHPFHDPSLHDFSPEGSKSVSLYEFLKEVEGFMLQSNFL